MLFLFGEFPPHRATELTEVFVKSEWRETTGLALRAALQRHRGWRIAIPSGGSVSLSRSLVQAKACDLSLSRKLCVLCGSV